MTKKILITGSRGQLGRSLQDAVPDGYDLISVDIDEMDIANQTQLLRLMEEKRPDGIINTAAYTNVEKAESEREKAYEINCRGVENLAIAAKQRDVPIVHVSTDYVFDGKNYKPYQPESKTNPINVYGQSKLAGEQKLLEIYSEKAYIVRTSWLYSQYGNNFVKTMLRLMNERDVLKVIDDQIGAPTSATTLAQTIWTILNKRPAYGIYHWTDAGVASWYDFAVAIYEIGVTLGLVKNKSVAIFPISETEYPSQATRPQFSVLDKRKTLTAVEQTAVHWKNVLERELKIIKNNLFF
ncbi:MAG: dTDP-4-dehydrorhamnose reductase [Planctomycetaceae bacterium]|jgi:dTDP-4-dehydrorhamnose reductase|nr:dTDP-4-dehydrorhamnose reductase [Planctomycetaceae bacterium]